MNALPPQPQAGHPVRTFLHHPFVIAIGIAIAWVVLVVLSDQLWRTFGFSGRDAWALAIGLLAYVALMVGAIGGIIWALAHEHQANS